MERKTKKGAFPFVSREAVAEVKGLPASAGPAGSDCELEIREEIACGDTREGVSSRPCRVVLK